MSQHTDAQNNKGYPLYLPERCVLCRKKQYNALKLDIQFLNTYHYLIFDTNMLLNFWSTYNKTTINSP